jgi:hypothetical protein
MPDTEPVPYVICVTGARRHDGLSLILDSVVDAITDAPRHHEIVLRHGACTTGTDAIVAHLCEMQRAGRPVFPRDITEDPMPADWDHCGPGCPNTPHRVTKKPGDIHHPGQLPDYCPKAGPRRNLAMNVKIPIPAVLLAYPLPGSYGTYSCMRIAATAGIPVKVTR